MALGPSLGDAYIKVHVDDTPFDRELEGAARKAAKDGDQLLDEIGRSWGDHLANETSKEVGRHGKDFARAIEDSVAHETVHVRSKVDYHNVRDEKGRFTKKIAQDFEKDVEDAFTKATGPGGPFDKIGRGIADAIGSGFNVSGKSPLIIALVPVVGAIAGLVVAIIELANLAAGVLAALPALIAAVGLQVGTLMLAFHGLGKAITQAFAAKNAQQLQEAIKGLTPEAQNFVKSLLPLRDMFHQLQQIAQSNFFKGFGNTLTTVVKALGPTFFATIGGVARALGELFAGIGKVFASPESKLFFGNLLVRTIAWLQAFTPSFEHFLDSFIKLSYQALPFLTTLGTFLSNNLDAFGIFLDQVVKSGQFKQWLASLVPILDSLGEFIPAFTRLIGALLYSTNKAGGRSVIDTLTDALDKLAFFFSSPAGVKALEGIIDFATISIKALTAAVVVIGLLAAAVDYAGESIKAFFSWLFGLIGDAIDKLKKVASGTQTFVTMVLDTIQTLFGTAVGWLHDHAKMIVDTVTSLPGKILGAVRNFGSLLFQAGKDLISGLISGIRNSIPGLSGALNWITAHLPNWKGPEDKDRKILEPAGRAVMSGFVTGLNAGATEVRDALTGLTQMIGNGTRPNTSHSVNFGPGSINISFMGNPTPEQAYQTGQAVGAGISSQLLVRDINLGVRRM